jgi:hypothetical protein
VKICYVTKPMRLPTRTTVSFYRNRIFSHTHADAIVILGHPDLTACGEFLRRTNILRLNDCSKSYAMVSNEKESGVSADFTWCDSEVGEWKLQG